MGLDVYLHRIPNYEDLSKREAEYEKRSEETWNEICGKDVKYEDIPEELKNKASAATKRIAKQLGLDKYGSALNSERESISIDSAKYPEHYWKVGYFRSSYNESGINRVLENALGTDLYDIVQPPDKEYEFKPDWLAVKKRATSVLKEFKAYIKHIDGYRVTKVEPNMFMGFDKLPKSEHEAMEEFTKVRDAHKTRHAKGSDFDWFSNGVGEYFLGDHMKLAAAIPGVDDHHYSGKLVPVTYLIYRLKDKDGYKHYVQSLEILIETCNFALAQPDVDKLYLAWSG
jgi:hypothetical protein